MLRACQDITSSCQWCCPTAAQLAADQPEKRLLAISAKAPGLPPCHCCCKNRRLMAAFSCLSASTERCLLEVWHEGVKLKQTSVTFSFRLYLSSQAILKLMSCLLALRSQVLQQSLSTGDAASQSLRVAPLRCSPLGKTVHADVHNEVAELGVFIFQCPLLKWV